MPSGDAQRVWFPEMIEHLRSHWRQGMSFEEIIELRNDLDAMLQRIRSEGNIESPTIKCPRCKRSSPGPDPHVSVRAMILSTARFDIAAAEETYALEKLWAVHRKQNGLNIYGAVTVLEPIPAACNH